MINKILSGFLFVLMIMLLASCAKDEYTEPLGNDSQEITVRAPVVPFKATYTTHPFPYEFAPPGFQTLWCENPYLIIPGEGKGTHMGKSTWYSESFVFPDGEGGFNQNGYQLFSAADGSTLEGYYVGEIFFEVFGPENPPQVGDVFGSGYGDYFICKGTTRFEGYTGTGTYNYYVEIVEIIDLENEDFILKGYLDFDGTLDKRGEMICEPDLCPNGPE
jgi:hypothetical protein